MTEQARAKANGWGKTYVVYSTRIDQLGIHHGPKFMEFENPYVILYWPHDIDHGGMTSVLCDKNFREDYIFIGEL